MPIPACTYNQILHYYYNISYCYCYCNYNTTTTTTTVLCLDSGTQLNQKLLALLVHCSCCCSYCCCCCCCCCYYYYYYYYCVVFRRWNTDLNKLEQTNKKLLADVLTDASRPLCSVYGAVIGLLAFGLNVTPIK